MHIGGGGENLYDRIILGEVKWPFWHDGGGKFEYEQLEKGHRLIVTN